MTKTQRERCVLAWNREQLEAILLCQWRDCRDVCLRSLFWANLCLLCAGWSAQQQLRWLMVAHLVLAAINLLIGAPLLWLGVRAVRDSRRVFGVSPWNLGRGR